MNNRHPVDRLAEIRAEIVRLEEEEAILRAYILDHPSDVRGDEYVATIGSSRRRKVNFPGLAAYIGQHVIERFTSVIAFPTIRLSVRVKKDAA